MKDLGKHIASGGVQSLTGNQLGVKTQGKGDFPRFSYQCDEQYKSNFKKIFGSKTDAKNRNKNKSGK